MQLTLLHFIPDYRIVLIIAEIPAFVVGLVLIYFWLEKRFIFTFREMGFNSNNLLKNIVVGIITGLALGILTLSLVDMMGIQSSKDTSNLFLLLIASCGFAPLFEEFLFRGLLFNFFMKFFPLLKLSKLTVKEEKFVTTSSYILIATMFTFSHMRIPPIWALLFTHSLIYTYLYHRTGNIATPIFAHSIYNLIVIIF